MYSKPKRGGWRKEAEGKAGLKPKGTGKRVTLNARIDPATKAELDKLKAASPGKSYGEIIDEKFKPEL